MTPVTRARRCIALVLSAALGVSGCATAGFSAAVAPSRPQQRADERAVLLEYVAKLPMGTSVRIARRGGSSVRGTLMKATDESLFIQPRTRLPEPPLEIPFHDVVSVTPDPPSGRIIAKAVAAGAAAGAAAALGVFLIILALMTD